MGAQQQKPKTAGSIYVNVQKGTSQEDTREVAEAVAFLRSKKAILKISVLASNGSYVPLTGFFNDYKEIGDKNPDIILRASLPATQSKPQPQQQYAPKTSKFAPAKPKVAPVQQAAQETDEFDGEGVPFA